MPAHPSAAVSNLASDHLTLGAFSFRIRLSIGAAVLVGVAAAALFFALRLQQPPPALSLIDETTLIVLKGDVRVQRAGGALAPAADQMILVVGDRVRTGADSYALITYFDGSTTEIEPESEIELRRLDRSPGGAVSVSFFQEVGTTWSRVERLVDAGSRFETTTTSAVAFVRGTEYRVIVEATGRTTVEAVTDTVIVETIVDGSPVQVQLNPGFLTTVERGRAPSPPARIVPPRFGLRVEVTGPVRPFLTDSANRSIGFHPEAGGYAGQIPAATHREVDNQQVLTIADPTASYRLTLRAEGGGGAYAVVLTGLVDGQPQAFRGPILARPLASEELRGEISSGALIGTRFEVAGGQVRNVQRPLVTLDGPPAGSRFAQVRGSSPAPLVIPPVPPAFAAPLSIETPAIGGTASLQAGGPQSPTPSPVETLQTRTTASPTMPPSFTPPPGPSILSSPSATATLGPNEAPTGAPTQVQRGGVLSTATTVRVATATPTATSAVLIAGRVTTPAGSAGIEGLWLIVTCSCPWSQEGPTAADGSFALRGGPGIYTLWVGLDSGYASSYAVRVDATRGPGQTGLTLAASRAGSTVDGAVRAETAAGVGISGATVSFLIPIQGSTTELVAVATASTDASGRYRVTIAPGSYRAQAQAGGYLPMDPVSFSLPGVNATRDFVLQSRPLPVTMSGRLVTGGSTPTGIAGVWLKVRCGSASCTQEAPTDADGAFTIRAGRSVVIIWADADSGYVSPTATRVDATATASVTGVLVTANRASASVTGSVRSAGSSGSGLVAHAEFSIPVSGSSTDTVPVASLVSDGAGSYHVNLAAGSYRALAWADGYQIGSPITVAISGGSTRQDFILERTGQSASISGRVVTSGGSGLAGIRLSVSCSVGVGLGSCTYLAPEPTSSDGSFLIRGAPGFYTLWASSETGYTSPRAVRVDTTWTSSATAITVTADRATVTVHGTVRTVSASGPPLAGAVVQYLIPVQAPGGETVAAARATTGGVGTYRLTLAAGAYAASVSAPGNPSEARTMATLTEADVTQDFVLAASPRAEIRGRVLASDGTPVSGVWLSVWCGCPSSQDAATDAAGAFTIRGDPASYVLSVGGWSSYTSPVAVRVDATRSEVVTGVTVIADPASSIVTGTVRSARGPIVPGASVRFYVPVLGSDLIVSIAFDRSGATGTYRVSMAPGTYTAIAEAPGYPPMGSVRVIVPEGTSAQDLILPAPTLASSGGKSAQITGQLVREDAPSVGIGGVELQIRCEGAAGPTATPTAGPSAPGGSSQGPATCFQQAPTADSTGAFSIFGCFCVYTIWAGPESGWNSPAAVRVDARIGSVGSVTVVASRSSTQVTGSARANTVSAPAVVNAQVEFLIPVRSAGAVGTPSAADCTARGALCVAVGGVRTVAPGRYSFNLAPGAYAARAYLPDQPPGTAGVVTVPTGSFSVDLPVDFGGFALFIEFSGTIVGADVSELGGTCVVPVSPPAACFGTVSGQGSQFTVSGGYGIYTMAVLGANHTSPFAVRVDPGPYFWDPDFRLRGFRISPITVQAQPATTQVNGTVRRSSGEVIPSARVRFAIPVRDSTGAPVADVFVVAVAVSNSNGVYSLPRKLAAGPYAVEVQETSSSAPVRSSVAISGSSFTYDVTLPAAGTLPTPSATASPASSPTAGLPTVVPTPSAVSPTPTPVVVPTAGLPRDRSALQEQSLPSRQGTASFSRLIRD